MAASSRTRPGSLSESITPLGSVLSCADSRYSGAAFASYSASAFTTFPYATANFFHHHRNHPASPNHVNLIGSFSGRFLDPIPAKRSPIPSPPPRKICMCSPTTHPGSFRCSLHKGCGSASDRPGGIGHNRCSSSPSNRLNTRRSALINSLVKIDTAEGELVKRALTALIRPSSHQQRRRAVFQPMPSRLSVMSMAADV